MSETAMTQTSSNEGTTSEGATDSNNVSDTPNVGGTGGLLNTNHETEADKSQERPADSIWGDKSPSWPEGMESDEWKSVREAKTLKNFVTEEGEFKIPAMMKALVNLDKLRGADSIVIPKKDASPEEKSEFMKKALGFDHEDISTYNLKEGVLKGEAGDELKKYLFESSLPTSIADGIVEKVDSLYTSFANEWESSQEKQIVEGVNTLKEKWADAFESKVATAKKALTEIGGNDLAKKVSDDPYVANHPAVVELMAKVGELMYQESPIRRNLPNKDIGLTRDEVREKINEYRSSDAYTNPRDKRHEDIHKKVDKLYKSLHT